MNTSPGVYAVTAPASPEAAQWDGWGTALKPAVEPAVLARKPLSGTVAQNVLQYGTGGINIDGCRIPTDETWEVWKTPPTNNQVYGKGLTVGLPQNPAGRWPSNILLDEEAAELLDQQSGESVSSQQMMQPDSSIDNPTWKIQRKNPGIRGHQDSGGASRFFYIAKASSSEREIGLQGMERKNNMRVNAPRENEEEKISTIRANHHPTVKPLQLMQYMIRLITPPGGTVLDPFMGSGSTGAAAMLERMQFVGIDITPDYIDIAQRRISYWHSRAYNPIIDAPVNVPKSIIKPVHSAQQTLDLED